MLTLQLQDKHVFSPFWILPWETVRPLDDARFGRISASKQSKAQVRARHCRGLRLAKKDRKAQMRNMMKSVLMACLLAAGAAQSNAQNTVIKVVQELHFKLTGYYQMSMTESSKAFYRNAGKVSVTNKDIINLLEPEVNIIFSSSAKLMLISDIPVDSHPKIVVRDRFEGERFDTDVTRFFSADVLASIEDTKINKNPLKANGSSYDVMVFAMNLTQVQFQVQGFGKTKVRTGKHEGEPAALVHAGKVSGSGNGAYQVNILTGVVPVALTGSVNITGTDVKSMTE